MKLLPRLSATRLWEGWGVFRSYLPRAAEPQARGGGGHPRPKTQEQGGSHTSCRLLFAAFLHHEALPSSLKEGKTKIISCFPILRAEPSWGSFARTRQRLCLSEELSQPRTAPLPRGPPCILRGLGGSFPGSR